MEQFCSWSSSSSHQSSLKHCIALQEVLRASVCCPTINSINLMQKRIQQFCSWSSSSCKNSSNLNTAGSLKSFPMLANDCILVNSSAKSCAGHIKRWWKCKVNEYNSDTIYRLEINRGRPASPDHIINLLVGIPESNDLQPYYYWCLPLAEYT